MFKRIFFFFKKERAALAAAVVCSALGSLLQLCLPFLMGRAIDSIHAKGAVDFEQLYRYMLLMLGCVLLCAAFNWSSKVSANKLAYGVGRQIRHDFMRKTNRLPISSFDSNAHGDWISRISNDVETITEGVQNSTSQLFSGIFTLGGTLALMLYLNRVITLIVVVLTPFAFLLSSFIVKKIDKTFKLQQKTVGEINAFAKEQTDAQKTVRAYALESGGAKKFEEINQTLCRYGQKAQFFSSLVNPTTRLINSSTYIIVGIVCALLVCANKKLGGDTMTIGLTAAFLSYSLQFAAPINSITNVTAQIQAAIASFHRIFEFFDLPGEPKEGPESTSLQVKQGAIDFDNVSFSYTKDKPILQNVSFSVKPGSKVAVVGPTGAGKTTLVNLLMRFYDPQSGAILIDGQNTANCTRDSVRTAFAMVLQDTFLFADTVENNIAYGVDGANKEQVEQAAKEAYCHSFIKRLPQGYQTLLSPDARELSAGQRQLLTIARAMLVNAPMLILDEATSSVDTLTEIRIQKAFSKLMQGKTSFVIAHRLSTIADSDLILVMDGGNIVEVGTHRSLLTQGGLYAKLYNAQFEK